MDRNNKSRPKPKKQEKDQLMKTKETETQLALAQIHYLLQGTQPTHSEADRAIRKALEITAHTLEKKRNMLEAQKVGLKTLNEFLRKSLPTPSAPCQNPTRGAREAQLRPIRG